MANPKMTLDDLRSQLTGLDAYQPEDEATLRQRAVDIYSPQYQSDLAKLRDQIEFQVDRQQRNAVKTGMQRSSYNAAQQASIRRGGLQSQADLAANYEGNIANMLYNMLEKEKDRQMTADQYRNELLLKLYDMQPRGGGGGGGINKTKLKDIGKSVGAASLYYLNNLVRRVNAGTPIGNDYNEGSKPTIGSYDYVPPNGKDKYTSISLRR